MTTLSPVLLTLGSITIVSALSLVGIFFLGLEHDAMERRLFFLISFAIGALIGDVFIHILPEIAQDGNGSFAQASFMIVGGILLSFVLEKIIHWRHCHTVDCPEHTKPLGTISLVGDAAHNMIDGLIIATSFLVDTRAGIATTIAVILHEIPQEIGDYAVLVYSGYSRKQALFFNFLTALTAFLGAFIVLLLHASLPNLQYYLFPLVAGNFLYIAVADLLPELHKETRISHSLVQLIGIAIGLGLMFLLTLVE